MSVQESSPRPLKWVSRLGWLVILGAIGICLAATTGAASERQLIAASVYPVVAFGAGVGLVIAARMSRSAARSSATSTYSAVLFIAACGAGLAALARVYFLNHIFDKL